MYDTPLTIDQVLTRLAEQPKEIAALTAGLPRARLQRAPSRGEWSVNGVLAHLRSCSDMLGRYMAAIITEDRPTIRAMNPRTWIKITNYPELEFAPSFRARRPATRANGVRVSAVAREPRANPRESHRTPRQWKWINKEDRMIDGISPTQFHESEGVEDWRVLGDGANAYFRTASFAAGARLVQAISELAGIDDLHPKLMCGRTA